MLIDSYSWTFTSTGTGSARATHGLGTDNSFYITSNQDSTATVLFETAASTGSTQAWGALGSTTGYNLTTGASKVIRFAGVYPVVRPRITDMSTGGVKVHLFVNGEF